MVLLEVRTGGLPGMSGVAHQETTNARKKTVHEQQGFLQCPTCERWFRSVGRNSTAAAAAAAAVVLALSKRSVI